MTSDFRAFGDPTRLEVALRWRDDHEPRERRPLDYGWSIGDLRVVVAGRNLTANARGTFNQPFSSWYLLPVFEWLACNWDCLLHDARYAWPERSAAPAAVATRTRLERLIDARDADSRRRYSEAQAWRKAHALRAASHGGLLPDLFMRRYLDSIELSWTAAAPVFAPDRFWFVAEPGFAYLPVRSVAEPLWQALKWAVETGAGRVTDERDAAGLAQLKVRLDRLEGRSTADLASASLSHDVAEAARAALDELGLGSLFGAERVAGAPAVERFSPAVAMFGSVAPDLTREDVNRIAEAVALAASGPGESRKLTALVNNQAGPPVRPPYVEGQDLAVGLLEDQALASFVNDHVDVEGLLGSLGVAVHKASFETGGVRGVALAGEGLTPTILVNQQSIYNDSAQGMRFTLAHELAHLLYDRSQAVSVGIASGPWAPPGVEKRANAFAAMLLMPRRLVLQALGPASSFTDVAVVAAAAESLRVSMSALIEHMANLEIIADYDREILRVAIRQGNY